MFDVDINDLYRLPAVGLPINWAEATVMNLPEKSEPGCGSTKCDGLAIFAVLFIGGGN